MEHEVIGTVIPHVEIRLASGESVYTEKGGMAWMDDGIAMDTSARGGEVAEYALAEGQKMKVDPGHVALFEPSVDFSIERVKGIKNMFLGGEGLFLATLTGRGRVWLQTMPLTGLAAAINRLLPRRHN
ncbi:MAG: AIM24 family protein [Chloroflexota bacterium]|jgi:uncharacterized protein (AIM24 family)|nr:AIM24 family protein [Chloroflexota bacterium]